MGGLVRAAAHRKVWLENLRRAGKPSSPHQERETMRLVAALAIVLGLVACTHNDFMPNVIQLSPNGTPSHPAPQSIKSSFTLTAVEDGYTGNFTAETVAGKCWVVQSPNTTGGAWTVVPQGTTCATKLDVERILVKDQKGNQATTYIRSTT